MRRWAVLASLVALAGCGGGPDEADAGKQKVECALEGAEAFERSCTIEEMGAADSAILVVGRSDVGYRRLQITSDGRGVVSADGAEPAKVGIVGDKLIEVTVGGDRYRLPASVGVPE